MNKKLSIILHIAIIIILIYLISLTDTQIKDSATNMNTGKYYSLFILSSICFSLLGFISDRQQVLKLLFCKKKIQVISLCIGVVVFMISSIPAYIWISQFGWGNYGFFKRILYSVDANHAMSIVAGVMIRQSFICDMN